MESFSITEKPISSEESEWTVDPLFLFFMGERIEKSHERQKDFFVGIGIMRRKSFEALISRLSHIYEVVLSWERVESGGIAQSTKISGE